MAPEDDALEQLVGDLERLSRALDAANPAEFDGLAAAVTRRGDLMTRLVAELGRRPEAAEDPALMERIQTIGEKGIRLEQRLRVTRARLIHEVGELYRTGVLMRTLRSAEADEPSVDYRG